MIPDWSAERKKMVDEQLRGRDITDERVLAAMLQIPREEFIPIESRVLSYADDPVPLDYGQTVSQPYITALMAQSLKLKGTETILEVGAGSGYAAAVLSRIAREVYAIERHDSLARKATRRLEELGYENVHVRTGDGTQGWQEKAPFNAILVAAGAPQVPETLKGQLAIGGRLIIPVGSVLCMQTLRKITRVSDNEYHDENLGAVAFVPLIGEHAWAEDGRRSASNAVAGRLRRRTPARNLPSPRER